ncbi:beta-ketoacyl synthase domain-containing protein [Phlyctema vagabunda]|uniref:Beta-ketoacyl synthase domain-containing protein n=1 Tax=Phlyctema vagabunda TaxID=108571 RepID=A0ABR4PTB7_9HELO
MTKPFNGDDMYGDESKESSLDNFLDGSPEITTDSEMTELSSQDSMPLPNMADHFSSDPSVVVGMACRVPGATNTRDLWKNLAEKKDLRGKMPTDRFNVDAFYHPEGSNKGTTNAKYGYFLDQDLSMFDNEFFAISGKEAESMDPQQRLLLEVVYEALENAGITLSDISGSRTSVFCGSFSNDYHDMSNRDVMQYPKYLVTGTGNALLSNRISYFYDLHGPSMTIDTACSSSLICLHLGSQSLQNQESDISIVAGSALHFDPSIFVSMTDLGMLATDGISRAFDAAGSGYARGEGVCAVILKRQSLAEANGDKIRAVIRATCSNHDGTKEGITVPNGTVQEALILETYKQAGISTADTCYFEAHGTGTKVGDPREAKAIGNVFASHREEALIVGSVKSNIGHLEGASGLAGFIKATMTVENGQIMPNLHFKNPNPEIDLEALKIRIPTEVEEWNSASGLRRASVNSFGYGGSNAHVIVENYVPRRPRLGEPNQPVLGRPFLAPLTSHSEKAGALWTLKLAEYVKQYPDVNVQDLAYTLSVRRSMHKYRSFVVASAYTGFLAGLENPPPVACWKRAPDQYPRVGFVFTGQGAQWHESNISQSLYSQPLCAAIQLGIIELLKAWDIKPSAVVGHSSGEIVAAYSAGLLSFEDAIICAYYRGLYMSKGVENNGETTHFSAGAMMAVTLTREEGLAELAAYSGRVVLAAVNSPSSLTFSGDKDAILEIKESLDRRDIFARLLKVEQAFHSHHMIPLAPAFEKALGAALSTERRTASCLLVSTVTGRKASALKMDAAYWAANMTGVVRYSEALTGILLDDDDERNLDVLVEIGAHPALKGPSKQILKAHSLTIPYLASLTRDIPAFDSLLTCAGQLFQLGYPVNLEAINGDISSEDASLYQTSGAKALDNIPTYAWDHRKFWAETRVIKELRTRTSRHSLLGARIPGTIPSCPQWRNYLRADEIPWLVQHVVDGRAIYPAAAFISMAIEAIVSTTHTFHEIKIRDLMFKQPLNIPNTEVGVEIVFTLQELPISAKSVSHRWYRFTICSFDENSKPLEHCHGQICAETGDDTGSSHIDCSERYKKFQVQTTRRRNHVHFYENLQKLGLDYGREFRLLTGDVESGPGFAIGTLEFYPEATITCEADTCILHPTVLDASFHTIFASIETRLAIPINEAFVPTFIRSMTVSGISGASKNSSLRQDYKVMTETKLPGARVAINKLCLLSAEPDSLLVNIDGLEVTALGNEAASNDPKRHLFFQVQWKPAFDQLGNNTYTPNSHEISDLMEMYVHQFPNADILHATPSIESTREVLRYLGGNSERTRRFHTISVHSNEQIRDDLSQYLESECSGLYNKNSWTEELFDVVVVSYPSDTAALIERLKPNGVLIIDHVRLDDQLKFRGLQILFANENHSIFRNSSHQHQSDTEDLLVLVSDRLSERTQEVCSRLRIAYAGQLDVIPLEDWAKTTNSTSNIISLVNLDDDLFFNHTEDDDTKFLSVQTLFKSYKKNIVWVLNGVSQETSNPSQALAQGLIRTIRNENQDLRLLTLDLSEDFQPSKAAIRILQVLDPSLTEDDVVDRDGVLYIPRIEADCKLNRKLPNESNRKPRLEPLRQDRPLALRIGTVGLLDSLRFDDDDNILNSDLADDEVEIEVRASAINFRDIAASMGIIDDYRLGDECSGVVLRTGNKVASSDFKPGDHVLACRPGQGAHRSIVRNPAMLCQKFNGEMDFVTAASFQGVLTTAYYSLVDVARIQPGEFCLVHSAAGGVGQMAIQLVQMLGGIPIATVGSQAKRDFLKESFGLQDAMIFSSRDPSFVDGVLKVTDGRGCDIAINSLAGELLHATWKCIAPFGRLIEIGKRDIHENSKLDMDPFRHNVIYASVDMITIYLLNKPLVGRLMRDSYRLITSKKVRPPGPLKVVSYAEAQKGFRLLQMGKYFGKVVLVPKENELVPVVPSSYHNLSMQFDPTKSYLLVGGLGGIGRALAEWMFLKGARKMIFFSRSGSDSAEAKTTVEWLVLRNVHVTIHRGDVSNTADVESCIRSAGHMLSGIFFAAMVLRDTPFATMSFKQWKDCVDPKVRGAYNLHRMTRQSDLDFFICFSSGNAVLGSMAQANYAAANCYLDALMRHRRENGLPGTTMNVGMVSGVGVVAQDAALESLMTQLGYEPITEAELFYMIEEALAQPGSKTSLHPCVENYDYHRVVTGINMQRKDLYWASRAIFRNLYANLDVGTRADRSGTAFNLLAALHAAKGPEEKSTILLHVFVEKVASVLVIPADAILPANPLSAYGLDSIVALEFRKWFSQTLGVDIPLFEIVGAKSITILLEKVMQSLAASSSNSHSNLGNTGMSSISPTAPRLNSQGKIPSEILALGDKANRPTRIPISSYQGRIWFLHNILADPSSLNFTVVCHARGKPSSKWIIKALSELVHRNEILRTSYLEGDDFTEQEALDNFPALETQILDLSHEADAEKVFNEVALIELRSKPLRIDRGESMRTALVKLSEKNYAMVFVFHHIAVDNGSTESAMAQFTGLYNALATGKDTTVVQAPKVSYADFTLWHNKKLARPISQQHIKWWVSHLMDAPATSRLLPFAKVATRPMKQTMSRTILRQILPSSVLKRMKRISSELRATPFQFLLSSFRAFIHRYTKEDDMTLLMVDGNRPHPEFDSMLGFFVNIVPLRCRNTCEGNFERLISEIKTTVEEARQHSDIPFDVIVSSLNTNRTESHFPLGQVTINYQMYAGKLPKYKTADFEITDVLVEDIPTSSDMALEATEDPRGLKLRFEYDSFLYGEDEMARFFENFVVFMTSVVKDHRQIIGEIEMCGPQELRHLKANCWGLDLKDNAWNLDSVSDRILMNVRERPGSLAIITSEGNSITYTELVRMAEAIAYNLQESHVQPGQLVGVIAKPSIDMVAAMMAVVFLRCGYVPLDHKFAQGRLVHMIMDSGCSCILVDDELLDFGSELARASSSCPLIISLSTSKASTGSLSPVPARPHDPFYVIYTSGSTGKPKGVLISHENIQSALGSHEQFHRFTADDTFLFHSSIAFDLSAAQIWGCLTAGAKMALATESTRQDPSQLATFIRDADVTITYFPSTQFATVLQHGRSELAACSRYRHAIFAGEYLPIRLVKAIYDLKTPVVVFNQWGPTETTIQTSSHKAEYTNDLEINLPVGHPLANCSHYVVDSRMNPVPADVVGELCIGGPQVGKGYLNLMQNTKDLFLEDPFASESFRNLGWTMLYKTGDKGRFLADGQIDFKGRISGDRQIKLRGLRIDLAEIEHEIHSASGFLDGQSQLADVAVLVRKRETSSDAILWTDEGDLVAFLVPGKHEPMNLDHQNMVDHIHSALKTSLNYYMLPSRYIFVPTLSKFVSSKVDRKWLLSVDKNPMYPSSIALGSPQGNLRTNREAAVLKSVTKAFRDVLKLSKTQQLDPNGSFFDFGGQSLLMLRLRSVLKRKYELDIPLVDLFKLSTPHAISKWIVAHQENARLGLFEIDWPSETTLPNDGQYFPRTKTKVVYHSDIKHVLVTGADSPLVIEILRTLLKAWPSATFHLIGTKAFPDDYVPTLAEVLNIDRNTPEGSPLSRICVYSGSLLHSNFGLTENEFSVLGRTVQVIYHLGVETSLLKSYQDLRNINVQRVLDIIKLSSYGDNPTPINYLSTWSVPHLQKLPGTKLPPSGLNLREDCPSFEPDGSSELGYFKSRWVAETLLCRAAERGFPVVIYRASAIVPRVHDLSSLSMMSPTDNFTLSIILATLDLGIVPDVALEDPPFAIDFVTTDYLSSLLVRLSISWFDRHISGVQCNEKAKYYHISNPAPLKLRDLPLIFSRLRSQGLDAPKDIVTTSQWLSMMRQRLSMRGRDSLETEIQIKVLEEFIRMKHLMFSLETTETQRELEIEGQDIKERVGNAYCPRIDQEFITGLLNLNVSS